MKAMKNLMLASLLIGLGACSNYEQDVLDASKYITVDAGFGTDSRVATTGLASVFEENDAIGVYAWTGEKTLPSSTDNFQVYNVANTYDGTNWTAGEQMLWKDDATKHYFLSVYPATDILNTTTYTLNPDDQEQSDLLIATNFGENNGGIAPQSNPVPLAFGHVMAKLRVNIMFNDELSDPALSVSEVIAQAKQTADIDWQKATAGATGDATGIRLPDLVTPAQGYDYSYESVMVPQDGFRCVDVKIGEKTYTFNHNEDIPLIKGKITTLNLIVGRSSVVGGGTTIDKWTLYGVVDGTKSIRFLPEYSDGKVMIETGMTSVDLAFIVSPKELVPNDANDVKAFIYRTESRTVDTPQALTVTSVSGDATTGMLTVSVTPPAEAYWATGKTANIYIQINDGNKDIISEMIPAYYYDYVTFSAGSVQTFSWATLMPMSARTSRTTTNGTFEYSVGGGEWQALAENQTVTFGGTNVDLRLRGIAPEGTNGKIIAFGNETLVACSGDIRTLVDYTNYETTSTANACFFGLFMNCSALDDASGLKLISNNDKMAEFCYNTMFLGCESLRSAPALPATTLAEFCYEYMFSGCRSLRSAPALPATTLAESCYEYMFSGCRSLTSAPALPATTLAESCYKDMFSDCESLTSAPELLATTLAKYCYSNMFSGCSNLTTAPALPATTLAESCYIDMFESCSSLTTAPALPAKTLVAHCYYQMFSGCTKLNSVTMLATNITANDCLTKWMSDVADTGTFTKAEEMTAIPTNSVDGIPPGWTVNDASSTGLNNFGFGGNLTPSDN